MQDGHIKKIIYFDTRTQAVSHFERIDIHLREKYRTFLLHVGSLVASYLASHVDTSWYRKDCEQTITGILCRDVSAYGGLKIAEILKQESPDLVIMLSLAHLQNRIMTAACKRLGIKVVLMMHGILRNQKDAQLLSTELTRAHRYSFLLKFRKIPQLLRLLHEYLVASGKMVDTLNIAFQLFTSPFAFHYETKSHYSLNVDKAFVYFLSDIKTLSERYKISSKKIVAVGCPKMDTALHARTQNTGMSKPQLLYLEQLSYDLGLLNDAEQLSLLSFLKEVATRNGLEFVIRLHPFTDRANFIRKFGAGYHYSQENEPMQDSLSKATITVGQSTTAMLEAIAYRIPTISLNWFKGAFQYIVVGDEDPGIVKRKELFEKKIQEFISKGWVQEETRKKLFPRGETPAAENIVLEIEKLIK